MTAGHYDVEPETVVRAAGILRILWVDERGQRFHLWNMAAPRLALLGEAITGYMTEHPEAAEQPEDQPGAGDQPIPLRPPAGIGGPRGGRFATAPAARTAPDDQPRSQRGPDDGGPPS
jgi:hypothetical protein